MPEGIERSPVVYERAERIADCVEEADSGWDRPGAVRDHPDCPDDIDTIAPSANSGIRWV
jgi:hypothetical protein